MLAKMSPAEVFRRLQEGTLRLVDIRDTDEFLGDSAPGALPAPLSTLGRYPRNLLDQGVPVAFTCQSGRRTEKNADRLASLVRGEVWQMEGGMNAWKKAGLPTEHSRVLPLFRQIQIAAGGLVLLGMLGGLLWTPFLFLSAFVGAGLILAGVTGFCGMGLLLSKLPWNRPSA